MTFNTPCITCIIIYQLLQVRVVLYGSFSNRVLRVFIAVSMRQNVKPLVGTMATCFRGEGLSILTYCMTEKPTHKTWDGLEKTLSNGVHCITSLHSPTITWRCEGNQLSSWQSQDSHSANSSSLGNWWLKWSGFSSMHLGNNIGIVSNNIRR